MNNFKTHFCESKDQAVPFALPGLRSYKQNLIFEDFKSRDKILDLENKSGLIIGNSGVNGSKTPVLSLKSNISLAKPQIFKINKAKVKKNEVGAIIKVGKNTGRFNEKLLGSKQNIKEDLSKENKQIQNKEKFMPTTELASLKAKFIESKKKRSDSVKNSKQCPLSVQNSSKNQLIPSEKSSKTLNFCSKPRLLNSQKSHLRPPATRSVSRKRPKKQSFFELNSISYKISELSLAPLL